MVKLQQEYFGKYSTLLKYEMEDEMAEVQQRLETWSKERLQREVPSLSVYRCACECVVYVHACVRR